MATLLDYINDAYGMALKTGRQAERIRSALVLSQNLVVALGDIGKVPGGEDVVPELLGAMDKVNEVAQILDQAVTVSLTRLELNTEALLERMVAEFGDEDAQG